MYRFFFGCPGGDKAHDRAGFIIGFKILELVVFPKFCNQGFRQDGELLVGLRIGSQGDFTLQKAFS